MNALALCPWIFYCLVFNDSLHIFPPLLCLFKVEPIWPRTRTGPSADCKSSSQWSKWVVRRI